MDIGANALMSLNYSGIQKRTMERKIPCQCRTAPRSRTASCKAIATEGGFKCVERDWNNLNSQLSTKPLHLPPRAQEPAVAARSNLLHKTTSTATKNEIICIHESVLPCSLFCSWFPTAFFGAMHLQRSAQMSKQIHAYKSWTSNMQLKITSGISGTSLRVPKCETGSQNC